MKKLSITEAELKRSVAFKKSVYLGFYIVAYWRWSSQKSWLKNYVPRVSYL